MARGHNGIHKDAIRMLEDESEDELAALSSYLEQGRSGRPSQRSGPWAQDEGYANTASPDITEDAFATPGGHAQQECQPILDLSFPRSHPRSHHSSNPVARSTYGQALAQRQYTSQSNTLSKASTQLGASQKSKTKRATSPCKNLADLQLLNKPVSYGVLNLEGADAVPKELKTLVDNVYYLCRDVGTIPKQVKDQISARVRLADLNSLDRDDFEVRLELDAMQRAHNAAVDLTANSAHKALWCCSVV